MYQKCKPNSEPPLILNKESNHWALKALVPDLVPYLLEAQFPYVLKAILEIDRFHHECKHDALTALLENLSTDQLLRLLNATLALFDTPCPIDVLTDLAQHLSDDQLQQALKAHRTIDERWLRIEVLSTLGPYLSEDRLQQVLMATLAIDDDWIQICTLKILVQYLSDDQLQNILQTTLNIESAFRRSGNMLVLAPYLTEKSQQLALHEGLQITESIRSEEWREKALVNLLSEQPVVQLSQVLVAVLALDNKLDQAQMLTTLVPNLSEPQLKQVLQTADINELEWHHDKVSSNLAPHLSDTQVQHILDTTPTYDRNFRRCHALSALAPYLSMAQWKQTLDIALASTDELTWKQMLSLSATILPDTVRLFVSQYALEVILELDDKQTRKQMLTDLVPYLSPAQLQQLMKTASIVDIKWYRRDISTILLPYIPEAQLSQALDGILSLSYDDFETQSVEIIKPHQYRGFKTHALSTLAPYLSGKTQQLALQECLQIIVLGIKWHRAELSILVSLLSEVQLQQAFGSALILPDKPDRATILPILIPYLSLGQLQYGLDCALSIADKGNQVVALSALIPHLSQTVQGSIRRRAFETALRIRDEKIKAKALSALVPYLSGKTREVALIEALTSASQCPNRITIPHSDQEVGFDGLSRRLDAVHIASNENTEMKILSANLAPYLSGEQKQRALQQGLELATALLDEDEYIQQNPLPTLAPHLSEYQLQETLETILNSLMEGNSAYYSLSTLVPHLSKHQLQQVYETVGYFFPLGPHLKKAQLQRILEDLLTNYDKYDDDSLNQQLLELAPHLTNAQLQQALEIVLVMEDEYEQRMKALSVLIPHLSDTQLQQAQDAIFDAANKWAKTSVVSFSTQQLSMAEQYKAIQRALEAALTKDRSRWYPVGTVLALVELLAQMQARSTVASDKLNCVQHRTLQIGLNAALAVNSDADNFGVELPAIALFSLAPHLPESLLVDAIKPIKNDQWWAWKKLQIPALQTLINYLSGASLQQAIEAAVDIVDEEKKLQTLAELLALVPQQETILPFVRQAISDYLFRNLQYEKRTKVLELISIKDLLAPPIFSARELDAIAHHIIEVCEEWQWL
ncbi:hypothetical protein KFU94_65900 [Chloroflexi bacterium TSY]|nr:hypothetical protein [Chloroflexi bacterium TSY]